MAAPPPTVSKTKYPTNLNVSGDFVLGESQTDGSVHEVASTFYSNDGAEHSVDINIWSRELIDEGCYIITDVPMSTDPLHIGIGDRINMRRMLDEFDGTDPDQPCLPPSAIFFSGVGVTTWVANDRKSCLVTGFTYISKKHGWQKYILRLVFEDTPKWAAWFVPGGRNLVNFDCILAAQDSDGVFKCWIRRIASIEAASSTLLSALDTGNTSADKRAERIRQNRAAARRPALDKGKAKETTQQGLDSPPAEASSAAGTTATPEDDVDQLSAPATRKRRLNATASTST
ncbi:hypothetical protein OC834_006171 [Tilletia horrida]|nr:hypothetical protein OC834_006171 [Tilletia horrida]